MDQSRNECFCVSTYVTCVRRLMLMSTLVSPFVGVH